MSQNISLKEAQRRAFRLATFQDGLWDIFLGSSLITMSFYSLLRSALGPALNLLLLLGVLVILLVGVFVTKRSVSIPRAGLVRFGPAQKATIKKLQVITVIFFLGTFAFWILAVTQTIQEPNWGSAPDWWRDLDVDILFTALTIGFFGLVAHALGIPRLHVYGWLLGLGYLLSTILHLFHGFSFHLPLLIAGATILLVGVVLAIRFVRRYPIPAEES